MNKLSCESEDTFMHSQPVEAVLLSSRVQDEMIVSFTEQLCSTR